MRAVALARSQEEVAVAHIHEEGKGPFCRLVAARLVAWGPGAWAWRGDCAAIVKPYWVKQEKEPASVLLARALSGGGTFDVETTICGSDGGPCDVAIFTTLGAGGAETRRIKVVEASLEPCDFASAVGTVLDAFATTRRRDIATIDEAHRDVARLKAANESLEATLSKDLAAKDQLEAELFGEFALVLNDHKRVFERQLEDARAERSHGGDSDDDDDDDDDDHHHHHHHHHHHQSGTSTPQRGSDDDDDDDGESVIDDKNRGMNALLGDVKVLHGGDIVDVINMMKEESIIKEENTPKKNRKERRLGKAASPNLPDPDAHEIKPDPDGPSNEKKQNAQEVKPDPDGPPPKKKRPKPGRLISSDDEFD